MDWLRMHAPQTEEQEIQQLFEDGDRALISGNPQELRRIYAEEYRQFDECGVVSTRDDLIERLISGRLRFISMISTSRSVRLLRQDLAVVHGSETDEVEQNGSRVRLDFVYMDIVEKRNGRWHIVESQLARPVS
jgi:hypothetical protein